MRKLIKISRTGVVMLMKATHLHECPQQIFNVFVKTYQAQKSLVWAVDKNVDIFVQGFCA